MKTNEGGADRIVRVVLGLIALGLAFVEFEVMAGNLLGIVIAALGAIALFTGIFGFCPAYKICGLSTSKEECCGDSCECNKE